MYKFLLGAICASAMAQAATGYKLFYTDKIKAYEWCVSDVEENAGGQDLTPQVVIDAIDQCVHDSGPFDGVQ